MSDIEHEPRPARAPLAPQGGAAFEPGDGVRTVFPRMAGKARPGVVVHVLEAGVVALPLTTRRTNQPGRLPMPEAELVRLGFDKRSHLVLPRAACLPLSRGLQRPPGVEGRSGSPPAGSSRAGSPRSGSPPGAVTETMLAQILGEMVEWYGLDWRAGAAALAETGAARLLHLRGRG